METRRHKQRLRDLGRTPTNREHVYRVELEVISVPNWAWLKRVTDLENTGSCIWLDDRKLASLLAKFDRENGGRGRVDRFVARRCKRCGVLRVGEMARRREELDESAVDGRSLPCGPECMTRYKQQRGEL